MSFFKFLVIFGVLGGHFGSQKVDAFFDRKTGTQVNPSNPEKSRDGGSRSPKNYQQDLPWTARPPEALHIVAEARWRIYIYIYIYIYVYIHMRRLLYYLLYIICYILYIISATVPRARCGVPPGALLSKGGLVDSS